MERNKGFIKGVLNNPLQLPNNSDWSNKLKVTTGVSAKYVFSQQQTWFSMACIAVL